MPWPQLKRVLAQAWGAGWRDRFETFDIHPVAAASIGQVHRARTKDGRDLAIKVQYPGVRRSINSDVDNVASLMRVAGLIPAGTSIAPMLAEAKRQLHEEADYEREGRRLAEFGALLSDRPEFRVPDLHPDLTTPNVLAMSFVEGLPVETLAAAPQAERNRAMTLLIGLLFRELFEFRLMQTDPNFANYQYALKTGQVILLDFGATRAFADAFVDRYRRLLAAGLEGDRAGVRSAALEIGILSDGAPARDPSPFLVISKSRPAPKTVAAFRKHMPFASKIIHVRWSGEGVWVPLGDMDFGVGFENNTCYPAPGQVVLYPGGVSETELLLAYGGSNPCGGTHRSTLALPTSRCGCATRAWPWPRIALSSCQSPLMNSRTRDAR